MVGEVEITGLSFKFDRDMTRTRSYAAATVSIPRQLGNLSEAHILTEIMLYFNSELTHLNNN